jgi:hypothetical protein
VANRVGCDYAIGVVPASGYAFVLVSGLLFAGRAGDPGWPMGGVGCDGVALTCWFATVSHLMR